MKLIEENSIVDKLNLNKLALLSATIFLLFSLGSAYEPPQVTQVSDSIRGPMNLTENSPVGQISGTQGIPTEVEVSDRETEIVTDSEGIDYEICVNKVRHAEGAELEYRYYQNTPPVEPGEAWTEERCYNTNLKWDELAAEVHIQVRDDRESPVEELETFNVDIYYYNLVNPELEDDSESEITEYDTVIVPTDEYNQLKNNQRDTERLERELEEKNRRIEGLENRVDRLADEIDNQNTQEESRLEKDDSEEEVEPGTKLDESENKSSRNKNGGNSQSLITRITGLIF